MSPEGQRELKAAVVAEQLRRLAGLDVRAEDITVQAVPGDADGLAWRTRVRLVVDDQGRAGLRAHRSHRVVPLADCPLAHPSLGLADLLEHRWPPGSQVVVVGGDGAQPTVHQIIDGRSELVAGPARRLEKAAGRRWRVSGAGFWQVHPGAADALVDQVRAALEPRPGDVLLDLYSGVGLFAGALAADLLPAGRAVAVESDPDAARDARRSLHDTPHVQLVRQRADRFLAGSAAPDTVDLVVLDPPRSGAGDRVCRGLVSRHPRRLAYVACDPASLARDLRTLDGEGYVLEDLAVLDLFPTTHHVECVATLRPADEPGRPWPAAPGDGRMVALTRDQR